MDDGQNVTAKVQSRAYQLEMFELAMQQNIIVAMDTGSGKTQIAMLRMEAELLRTPHKRVWFTAPSVVLAEQQYESVKLQLPQFRSRTLLGHDNVDLWRTQQVWDKALGGCNIVICTPQVLLDALKNAFVPLDNISLLVIDEAHHCRADSSLALIMREIYHPQREKNRDAGPHILGLTASPLMNCNQNDLRELETILDATCKSPTRSIVEYQQYVHLPQLVCLHHTSPSVPSDTIVRGWLRQIVQDTAMSSDPYYQYLCTADDLASKEKLKQLQEKGMTPAMKELKTFLGHADHIFENLGTWACDDYIIGCTRSWHDNIAQSSLYDPWMSKTCASFVNQRLEPLRRHTHDNTWHANRVATKASVLIRFLEQEYRQVAEEGIDIQAVNLVIRFDEPKTFISYIQSRGRARKQYSKFAHFPSLDKKGQSKYGKWTQLEADMKAQYQNEMRQLAERQRVEAEDESGDEIYTSDAGALLNYRNARAHLQHFCSTLARPTDPIMILSRTSNRQFTAQVVLPSCLAVELQRFRSKNAWNTEKLAKRSVSFQAVKRLHEVNLIDDHFMPPRPEKVHQESIKHGTRLHTICAPHEVWCTTSTEILHRYRVEASCGGEKYAPVFIALAQSLKDRLSFDLQETVCRILSVSVTPDGVYRPQSIEKDGMLTRQLFEQIFGPGSARASLDDAGTIPFICVPAEENDFSGEDPAIPLTEAPLIQELFGKQPLLLWQPLRPRPYLHISSQSGATHGERLQLTKIKKAQIFTRTIKGADMRKSQIPVMLSPDECLARAYGTVYGPTVLLVPSILEVVSAALRAQEAETSTLQDIRLSTSKLLVSALLAKSAAGTINYERLEFLGDALLKFYAHMHMFSTLPLATEGMMTEKVAQLVSNMSLENAMLRLGLERFVTTECTSSKHWKLPSVSKGPKAERKVLSKTLADMVESTLAAAYLDVATADFTDHGLLRALNLFLPETGWQSVGAYMATCLEPKHDSIRSIQVPRQVHLISDMLGHTFTRHHLLVEALTHSHHAAGRQSLDRLEFLGDAILDRIIKERLYHYSALSAARMTICRHALAGHALLAYLALGVKDTEQISEIKTRHDKKITCAEEVQVVNLIDLVVVDGREYRRSIRAAMNRHRESDTAIVASLDDNIMPWTKLHAINAPKVCSDIIESLVAAVFIDSNGSFTACENMLNKIGLLPLLDRMANNNDFDVMTPVAKLHEKHSMLGLTVSSTQTKSSEDQKYAYRGRVHVAGGIVCETEEVANKDEAESKAAETALKVLAARDTKMGDVASAQQDGNADSREA